MLRRSENAKELSKEEIAKEESERKDENKGIKRK